MLMGVGSKVMGIYDTYVNCFWPYASDQNAVIGEIKPDAIAVVTKSVRPHRLSNYPVYDTGPMRHDLLHTRFDLP